MQALSSSNVFTMPSFSWAPAPPAATPDTAPAGTTSSHVQDLVLQFHGQSLPAVDSQGGAQAVRTTQQHFGEWAKQSGGKTVSRQTLQDIASKNTDPAQRAAAQRMSKYLNAADKNELSADDLAPFGGPQNSSTTSGPQPMSQGQIASLLGQLVSKLQSILAKLKTLASNPEFRETSLGKVSEGLESAVNAISSALSGDVESSMANLGATLKTVFESISEAIGKMGGGQLMKGRRQGAAGHRGGAGRLRRVEEQQGSQRSDGQGQYRDGHAL